jgi:hypothetical protein
MVAFRASRFVCSEIPVITSVTLLISFAALPSLFTFSDALFAWQTASLVIKRAFSEFCADRRYGHVCAKGNTCRIWPVAACIGAGNLQYPSESGEGCGYGREGQAIG